MVRNSASSAAQSGSALMACAILASRVRPSRAMAARMASNEASASGSVTRRRWFFCSTAMSVSWRRRVTHAASWAWVSGGTGVDLMRLVSANHAIMPASILSVFSRLPMASAKRRTWRGLTMAVGRPAAQRWAKGACSYPPVASMAQRSTLCRRQKAARASRPGGVLAKRWYAPARPMRASRCVLLMSIPQRMLVTVTCLVHATGNRATVRLCVTRRRPVPRLTHGCCLGEDGRQPPRGRRGGGAPPPPPPGATRSLPNPRANVQIQGGLGCGAGNGPCRRSTVLHGTGWCRTTPSPRPSPEGRGSQPALAVPMEG